MAINKVISAAAFALTALLLHQTTQVGATCICPAVYFLPSEYAEMGAIVLRAEVLSRSDVDDTATYELDLTTLYVWEPDIEPNQTIYFVTAASTDDCGVDLKIGGDYLLGLSRRTTSSTASTSDGSAKFELHACSLNKLWNSVFEEELDDLAQLLEENDSDNPDDD